MFVVINLNIGPSPGKADKYSCGNSYSLFVKLNCWRQCIMIVYKTVYGSLMDYVCILFCCRKSHFQLV